MKIDQFSIQFSKENSYRAIDCYKDSPVYGEVEEEYAKVKDLAYEMIQPCAYLAFGEIPACVANEVIPEGSPVLYVLTTIGKAISNHSSHLFETGNYLAGLLIDAMADDYLFQMEGELQDTIITMCQNKGFGVKKRVEAPNGIRMEIQRIALETIKSEEETDISIKESFMYDPLKTVCQVFLLEKGSQEYHIQHNCRECPAIHCKRRQVQAVQVVVESVSGCQESVCILCEEGQSIHQALTMHDIYVSAVCAGRGTCGKCKIRVIEGEVPLSDADMHLLTEKEQKKGVRLACKAYPKTDCKIIVETKREETFTAVADFIEHAQASQVSSEMLEGMGIGIDIGTTTIAMQLVEIKSGQIRDTYTAINKQRAYGADVVSRILKSNQGKQAQLKECIVRDLVNGVHTLLNRNGLEQSNEPIIEMSIAGNTTMTHLLLGYSCETLGVYPFKPVCIDTIRLDWTKLTGETCYHIPVVVLPGISTYVGADITAGILACGMDRTKDITLLLDIGTNGEMAIGNCEKILTTSAAAGPAFEGGNISCGTGSIQGAICNIEVEGKQAKITTIGDKKPVGICGTGVIEIVYELLKESLMDETGLLQQDYFEEGFCLTKDESGKAIVFTQKDVREIQLAKSAIRAGIETLLLRYGVSCEEVKRVYVAGGFGYQMDFLKAFGIGLFPRAFEGKITAVGNSSLNGAIQYLTQKNAEDRVGQIIGHTEEMILSNDMEFNEKYLEYMFF